MLTNGSPETQALVKIDAITIDLLVGHDPTVGLPTTAHAAALATDWLGFRAMLQDPAYYDVLKRLPQPQPEETALSFVERIWPLLGDDERGMALALGLQSMVTLGHLANTGIQLRIWRAFKSGEWRHSPGRPADFRSWVRSIIADTLEGSATEASCLATVCEVVQSLEINHPDFLPGEVESIFRRPHYRKWRAVAAKIAERIGALGGDEDQEIFDEIDDLVKAAQNLELTNRELDAMARQAPRVPVADFVEISYDPKSECYTLRAEVTATQLELIRQRLRGLAEIRLAGGGDG